VVHDWAVRGWLRVAQDGLRDYCQRVNGGGEYGGTVAELTDYELVSTEAFRDGVISSEGQHGQQS
jgi:hypothetical protein